MVPGRKRDILLWPSWWQARRTSLKGGLGWQRNVM